MRTYYFYLYKNAFAIGKIVSGKEIPPYKNDYLSRGQLLTVVKAKTTKEAVRKAEEVFLQLKQSRA